MDVRCFTPDEPRRPAPRPVPGGAAIVVGLMFGVVLALWLFGIEWGLR